MILYKPYNNFYKIIRTSEVLKSTKLAAEKQRFTMCKNEIMSLLYNHVVYLFQLCFRR